MRSWPLQDMHILLVEDDPLIRDLLAEALNEAEFNVVEAGSAEEAIALLERRTDIRLLLTDVHMPGRFNGMDVARAARARCPELPVVFATGRPETLMDFDEFGEGDVCLAKPFSPSEAVAKIEALLSATARS